MSDQEAGRDSGYANGALGILFSLIVLATLVVVVSVYKAYRTTFQRLILYYIIIGLSCELTFALQIVLNFSDENWICTPIIYFYLYFPLASHVYITAVTNCTLLLTLRLLRGKISLWRGGKWVELVCIVLTVIVPVFYIWIPIRDGSFEAVNCNKSDQDMPTWNGDAIILNLMVLAMCVEVLLVCIVLCSIFCAIRVRLRIRNRQTAILLKHLLFYSGINAMMMTVNLLSITYCFCRSKITHLSNSASVIINVIIGTILPLIIFISVIFQAILSIRTANSQSGSHTSSRVNYMRKADEFPTNPTSHPINQPSHTYFSTPYTGAFTEVSSNEHSDSDSEDEGKPLLG